METYEAMQLVENLDSSTELWIGRVTSQNLSMSAVLRLVQCLYTRCINGDEMILNTQG